MRRRVGGLVVVFLILSIGSMACGNGGGGDSDGDGNGNGNGNGGGDITEAELQTFYETQEPQVRAGALNGLWRLLQTLRGTAADGVRTKSTGATTAEFEIDLDLDGNGSRETTIVIPASFSGNPLDGLSESDFPATAKIVDQETPIGTWSSDLTVTTLGGDGTGPTIFSVEGTSGLVNGAKVQTNELGYTVDLTFAFTPLFGSKDIEITKDSSNAKYDVSYDSNTSGNQWIGVEGLVDGISFDFELFGPRDD